jgi:hypothetical protein
MKRGRITGPSNSAAICTRGVSQTVWRQSSRQGSSRLSVRSLPRTSLGITPESSESTRLPRLEQS